MVTFSQKPSLDLQLSIFSNFSVTELINRFLTIYNLEVRQKYSAARRIFNSPLGVSSGDETLRLMFDILLEMTYV